MRLSVFCLLCVCGLISCDPPTRKADLSDFLWKTGGEEEVKQYLEALKARTTSLEVAEYDDDAEVWENTLQLVVVDSKVWPSLSEKERTHSAQKLAVIMLDDLYYAYEFDRLTLTFQEETTGKDESFSFSDDEIYDFGPLLREEDE